ncbi:copper chaperone PCu(A)C [bacterium]|nr:copper chaperone PCu(A)C [bacterium]
MPEAWSRALTSERSTQSLSRRLRLAVLSSILGLASCDGGAGSAPAARVADAVFRPPVGQSSVSVAYMSITSPAGDRLVAASSPMAAAVEMHEMVYDGAQVSMRRVDGVDLPAGQAVRFEPGGLHLMIIEPRTVAGEDTFPIVFELQSGASLTVEFDSTRAPERSGGR